MTAVYLLLAVFLLLLNAFFVLAEFALVRLRSSREEERAAQGLSRAIMSQHCQNHID